MSSSSIQGQCPHCGSRSPQALLPTATLSSECYQAGDVLKLDNAKSHTEQRLVCSACEKTWEAAIVPLSQMQRLLEAVSSLDDARRQIAMMRLIMSKDQIDRAERSQQDIIKLHHAA